MKKSGSMEQKVMTLLLLLFMIAGGILLLQKWKARESAAGEIAIKIEGRVLRPGTYRVPYGTTTFEILQVAGVYDNSDLNGLNVFAQASDGERVSVGTLEKNVALRPGSASLQQECAVNFFVGSASLLSNGQEKKLERLLPLKEGDRIECREDGIVELRLMDGSLLDIKKQSMLNVKKLYRTDETGGSVVDFQLTAGRLWAFINPQPQNIRFYFSTPQFIAEIKGTEVEIAVDSVQSRINVIKGTVSLERIGTAEGITLSSGQKATVVRDLESRMETGEITDLEKDKDLETFNSEKSRALSEAEAKRFLYLGLPDYYMLVEINPNTSKVSLIRINPRMPVKDYVEGVNELGKVYLYGGIGLVASVIERISNKRIEKNLIHEPHNVATFIDLLGGVTVNLDESTAHFLNLKRGLNRLDGKLALKYMAPGRDDREESLRRQNEVFISLYKGFTEQRIIYSTLLAGKILADVHTDMDIAYMNSLFDSFKKRNDWNVEFTNLVPH